MFLFYCRLFNENLKKKKLIQIRYLLNNFIRSSIKECRIKIRCGIIIYIKDGQNYSLVIFNAIAFICHVRVHKNNMYLPQGGSSTREFGNFCAIHLTRICIYLRLISISTQILFAVLALLAPVTSETYNKVFFFCSFYLSAISPQSFLI